MRLSSVANREEGRLDWQDVISSERVWQRIVDKQRETDLDEPAAGLEDIKRLTIQTVQS